MHQSEIAIHEIEVITQTLASRIDQLRSILSRNHLEIFENQYPETDASRLAGFPASEGPQSTSVPGL